MTIHILVGFCLLLIGCVFSGLVSAVLWVRLRTGVRHLDAPLFLALWMFVVTMLVMCACALGVLEAWGLAVFSVAGGVAIALLFRRDLGVFRDALHGARSAAADFGRDHPGLTALYVLLFFVLALRTFVHAWLLPPYIWDTLVYHLPRIAEWIQNRGLFMIDTPIDRLYWPANFELFQCWFVVFFHHDFIVELAGVFPYALAVLSVYSICRSFGVSALWASGAAAIFSTTPTILQSAVSCKNDIAVAAWFLFMAAAIAEMARNRGPVLSHGRYVAILALAFGVALGTKAYIVFIAPGLVVLYVLLLMNRQMRSQTRAGEELGAAWVAVVLALSLFVGLFWYARNAVVFDNPLYPAGFRILGHEIKNADSSPEYQRNAFRWKLVPKSYRALPDKLLDRAGAFTPEIPGMAGWGCFAVACGIPALVLMLFRRSPLRALTLSCLVSLTCLFALVAPDMWYLRFTLWFSAIFPVAFVLLIPSFRCDPVRQAILWLAGVCAVLNVAATLNNGYLKAADWRNQFHTPVLERSSAELVGSVWRHVLRTVPRGETIGYDMHPNGWLYPLYGADYAWKVKFMNSLDARDVPALMRKAGVHYLFIPYRGNMTRAKIAPYLAAGSLRDAGGGLYVLPK